MFWIILLILTSNKVEQTVATKDSCEKFSCLIIKSTQLTGQPNPLHLTLTNGQMYINTYDLLWQTRLAWILYCKMSM